MTSDDLIHAAARKGWLGEAAARAKLKGREPTPDAMVRSGLLTPRQVELLLSEQATEIVAAADARVPGELPADVEEAMAFESAHLGHYVLVRELGRGGFGTVWLAWDTELRRRTALKVLKGQDPAEIERFMKEARTAASLTHQNIAHVYEVGQLDDEHFIALQYIDGETLSRVRLKPEEALRAIRDVARAVDYAHGQGIIHRDIKPQNIMREVGGRVYILDFGIARSLRGAMTVTETIVGTPVYMSPEQAAGELLDARSDVYGLGATLYELVTGQAPYVGESALDVLRQVLDQDPPAPRMLNPRLDGDVETIVMTAMTREPARRYAGAAALADDIDRFLSHDLILARPASALYRLRSRIRRRPAVWALSVLLLLSIVAGGTFGVRALVESRRNLEAALHQETLRAAAEARLRIEADARVEEAKAQALVAEARSMLDDVRVAQYVEGYSMKPYFDMLEAARARCLEANEVIPDYGPAWHWIGRAFAMEGRYDEAIEALLKATSREDTPDYVWAELGKTYVKWGRARGASGMLPPDERERIMREASEKAEACFERAGPYGSGIDRAVARAYKEAVQRQYEDALATAEAALDEFRAVPGVEELYFLLGGITDGEARIEYLTQAVRICPGFTEAWFQRGNAYLRAGDPERAQLDFSEAIRIHPTFAPAYKNRGDARAQLDNLDGAKADYDEAVRLTSDEPWAYLSRGLLHERRQDYARAVEDLKAALARTPNDPTLRAFVAGHLERAQEELRAAEF